MKIVVADPPNIAQIAEAFPHRPAHVIYAFGDTIYNPGGKWISAALVAHEGEHGIRQADKIEEWWDRYLKDPEWRYIEEVFGHVAELRQQIRTQHFDRNYRTKLITSTALRLISPMYEYKVPLAKAVADLKTWL